MEKSREAVDIANIRSAYAEVMTTYLTEGSADAIDVTQQQKVAGWDTTPAPSLTYQNGNGTQEQYSIPDAKAATGTFAVGVGVNATDGSVSPSISVK